jgi:L-threonylcarbamoyladenylate synthase
MKTKIWKMPGDKPDLAKLSEAADLLRAGEVVAFPTETVYGLGANALEEKAVEKIYLAKGRPSDNPLIVHISSLDDVRQLVSEIPPKARRLMEVFWPGPLTLVMPKAKIIPQIITGGLDTVGIRFPAHPVALKLIELAKCPVAAPSANISGKPSPTTAEHVWQDLNGKIAGIVDGGKADVGVESTVLDVTEEIPIILRPGGITLEQLEDTIGEVKLDSALYDLGAIPKAPGMKYTHYAPEADVIIIKGSSDEMLGKVNSVLENSKGERVGIMASQELIEALPKSLPANIITKVLGSENNLETITANLFDTLRWFDQKGVRVIYAESFPDNNIGAALMNRLIKAAGGKTI